MSRRVLAPGTVAVHPDARHRFLDPCEVATPAGAERWRDLYSYALVFDADGADDDGRFWFRDTIHWAKPIRPFEAAVLQRAVTALSEFNHRWFVIPGSSGLEVRLLNGYAYLSPGSIEDPVRCAERAEEFEARAGHYYAHWDELYAGWRTRVGVVIDGLEAVTFGPLPEAVPLAEVTGGIGLGRAHRLSAEYHRLLDLVTELWQYHFEFLNLGYAAYLGLFGFCREHVGCVAELDIARMIGGIDADLFRPDRELRRLAHAAVESGLADALCSADASEALQAVADAGGRAWLADFERIQQPWFNYSTGSGFYFDDRVWIDALEVPIGFIRSYVEQLRAGHEIDVSLDAVLLERDHVTSTMRQAVPAEHRAAFDEALSLARLVSHYVENHNFYVEHWGMSLVWRKMRDLSNLFVKDGCWHHVDDIFFLTAQEIDEVLWDVVSAWASDRPPVAARRWPGEIDRRRTMVDACAATTPPPALGTPPPALQEPFTVMLWGITSRAIDAWLEESNPDGPTTELRGIGASPGVCVGPARVVRCTADLDEVLDGEVLVAELTSPSWAPVFAQVAGTVTEVGGLMSHSAIVCREYGLPAVTGVSRAMDRIRTGQMIRVDGTTGLVVVLD